jgi:hypothetical protein
MTIQTSHDTYLQAVGEAHGALDYAKNGGGAAEVTEARQHLRTAVGAARDAGATWMHIGDRLGIARGNAYQRYRERPAASENLRMV